MTELLRRIFVEPRVINCKILWFGQELSGRYDRRLGIFYYAKDGNGNNCIALSRESFDSVRINESKTKTA